MNNAVTTDLNLDGTTQKIVLGQNQPNPFSEYTTINYVLPEDAQNSRILIHDLNGKVISEKTIHAGAEKMEVLAGDLKNGSYTYSIVVGDQLEVTKE